MGRPLKTAFVSYVLPQITDHKWAVFKGTERARVADNVSTRISGTVVWLTSFNDEQINTQLNGQTLRKE